jgi:hypothetical protein
VTTRQHIDPVVAAYGRPLYVSATVKEAAV